MRRRGEERRGDGQGTALARTGLTGRQSPRIRSLERSAVLRAEREQDRLAAQALLGGPVLRAVRRDGAGEELDALEERACASNPALAQAEGRHIAQAAPRPLPFRLSRAAHDRKGEIDPVSVRPAAA